MRYWVCSGATASGGGEACNGSNRNYIGPQLSRAREPDSPAPGGQRERGGVITAAITVMVTPGDGARGIVGLLKLQAHQLIPFYR